MPQSIQNPPFGFLDLIGAKSMGQNPNLVVDDVRATLELTPFELVGRSEDAQKTEVLKSLRDDRAVINVPAGELWWVQQMSGFLNVNAGGGILASMLRYRTSPNGFDHTVAAAGPQTSLLASSRQVVAWTPVQPLLLSSGSQMLLVLNEDVGGGGAITVSMGLTINFVRLSA